ncbi:5-deoxy-glucuronate isomerase [Asanoa sp. WMMD1127]|uniref:5-deoxy-glucuronate isomerase n=1 Tax=Asanoa sp. WMMD1127 TaxID=3016107 RepID=UPI002415A87F|nr:5-deoxy-glucuronate isomerase [Asanoa sp. WMMD1127]MDG4824865.1 5-deoxy-glucuronate isomerase [Asanoa sp. WMMD1127]
MSDWFRPQCTSVDPDGAGWQHAGLRIVTLAPGSTTSWRTEGNEAVVVPLAGAASVSCAGAELTLHGRADVFTAATDLCYLPPGEHVTLASPAGGRFAVAYAAAEPGLPVRYRPAADVPIEVRGAGLATRQVNNLADAVSFECRALIVVEVLTPGGNWSSYPPHKHDEHRADETALEEIYYFEVARGGPGYQRVYASAPDRPIDVLAEVRTGDVVLVPHGWHGPSMAAPGYDLYYLNVMAGPGERAWRFRDDPAHAWIRDTWADQPTDPRVPLYGRSA